MNCINFAENEILEENKLFNLTEKLTSFYFQI